MAEWIQLTTACDAQAAETLENALLELGAVSVTLQDVADVPIFEPDLGTTPLWPRTQLLSLFEQGHDMQQVTETLQATWPELSIQVEALADQN